MCVLNFSPLTEFYDQSVIVLGSTLNLFPKTMYISQVSYDSNFHVNQATFLFFICSISYKQSSYCSQLFVLQIFQFHFSLDVKFFHWSSDYYDLFQFQTSNWWQSDLMKLRYLTKKIRNNINRPVVTSKFNSISLMY